MRIENLFTHMHLKAITDFFQRKLLQHQYAQNEAISSLLIIFNNTEIKMWYKYSSYESLYCYYCLCASTHNEYPATDTHLESSPSAANELFIIRATKTWAFCLAFCSLISSLYRNIRPVPV
jgi:hypothetical protein